MTPVLSVEEVGRLEDKMFTKEAQALAKATVEAIKKIAERPDKVCPECGGELVEKMSKQEKKIK